MTATLAGLPATNDGAATGPALLDRYRAIRARTEALCEPLATEDYVVSSMPDVSPTKWHLAHTSWFFETFVLAEHAPSHRPLDPRYAYLFNSYYVQAGERHCRAKRGLVTRPTVEQVFAYRDHVDAAMIELLERIADDTGHPAAQLVELGLHHEQQHQELLITDIKHVFWMNPLRPAYGPRIGLSPQGGAARWVQLDEGVRHIGHAGGGFSYDNESPRHRVFLEPFSLGSRLVTNGEYLAFIEDGGYTRPELWLSAGLAVVQDRGWFAPLYWERDADGWSEFTLEGQRPLGGAALDEPVCHVSFYEADAFARWSAARLPTEHEWEVAAVEQPERLHGLFDAVWQWTNSAYVGYPGYAPAAGAIGEYNGKWMADQWVLRGSSCATSPGHSRHTYRNFFPSDTRWQFTGIRLARSAEARR